MATCRFCGQKAGMFSTQHDACVADAESSRQILGATVSDAIMGDSDYKSIQTVIAEEQTKGRLTIEEVRIVLLEAASKACNQVSVNTAIDYENYGRIRGIISGITPEYPPKELKERRWFGLLALDMSNIIYQVLHKELPAYDGVGRMAFQLERNEQPIFCTGRTVLAVYKTVSPSGVYQSVGLPIGHGLYYRLGTHSRPSSRTGLVPSDEGQLLFTTRAIYFGGQQTNFKIPYRTILRIESFVDAIGVFRSSGGGHVFLPDYSGMDVGWFFYNLLTACMGLDT
jgi:hypothetical protein